MQRQEIHVAQMKEGTRTNEQRDRENDSSIVQRPLSMSGKAGEWHGMATVGVMKASRQRPLWHVNRLSGSWRRE